MQAEQYSRKIVIHTLDGMKTLNALLLPLVKSNIIQILLYGSNNYIPSINKLILSVVIDFIIQSKRFNDPLIQ